MIRSLAFALAGLSLAACSSVQYGADYDSQVSFSQVETYGIMTPNEEESDLLRQVSPFLERRLERAVHEEMTSRGLVQNTDGTPDVWVSAYPVLPSPIDVESAIPLGAQPNTQVSFGLSLGPAYVTPGVWGFPYHHVAPPLGFGGYGYGAGCCAFPAIGFGIQSFGGYGPGIPGTGVSRAGTLVVEVLDGESQELVWQGWAENALQEAPESRYLDEYVQDLVSRVMQSFPPVRDGS